MKDAKTVKRGKNETRYHKETFEKISESKRGRILSIATTEFAKKGFKGANINEIARKANISIGSMYTYFETKENLYLTVVDEVYKHLENAIASTDVDEGDIFDKLEKIIRVAQKYSREHPDFIKLYQDIASEGLARQSTRLSRKIENISAVFYRRQINEAKKQGIVGGDIDDHVASYCIDNIILLMQFSYTSAYYKERLKAFVGDSAHEEDERVVQGMVRFIRRALEAR